jgi:hypothetical protein
MKLKVKANDETGFWEIHDESGFLCKLESESTARQLAHAANVLPELVAAVKHLQRNWGKNLTKPMARLNKAVAQAQTINRSDQPHLN